MNFIRQIVAGIAATFICGTCFAKDDIENEVVKRVVFGSVEVGTTAKKVIRIRNPFGVDLKLKSVTKDCGCAYPEISNESFRSNDDIEVKLVFAVGRIAGGNSKIVTLHFLCEERVYVLRLELFAMVRSQLEISTDIPRWNVDPEHISLSEFRFVLSNYFRKGSRPVVTADGIEDVEVVSRNLSDDDVENGVMASWDVVIKPSSDWSKISNMPSFVSVFAKQIIGDAPVSCERIIQVRTVSSISIRPRVVSFNKETDFVELQIFVHVSNWKPEELCIMDGDRILPIELVEASTRMSRVRIKSDDLFNAIQSQKFFRVGFRATAVHCTLEVRK